MNQPSYVFADTESASEYERLSLLQAVFDPFTQDNFDRLGVAAGWICLEVGAGAGSMMLALCDRVGETGRVVAIDRDPRFILTVDRPNLTVQPLDITTTPLPENCFDLVHLRAVLMHIPHSVRKIALSNLLQALKPGGWLLIEEPDFASIGASDVADLKNSFPARVFSATRQVQAIAESTPFMGRQLPLILQQLSLGSIKTNANIDMAVGGSLRAKIWCMSIAQLQSKLLATGNVSEADIHNFMELMADPTTWFLDYAMIAAWGQKP